MLNTVVLIGRLTADPTLRYTPGGKAVCNMRLAVDRGTTNAQGEREVDFIDCVAWERQAESTANFMTKGRLIAVSGRLQIRQFDDQEGRRRERAEVVANTVRFLDRGQDAGGQGGGMGTERPRGGGGMGSTPNFSDDDDVPF